MYYGIKSGMVFSILHWVLSAIAVICTILLVFVKKRNDHRVLSYSMIFFALIGLLDYISQGNFTLFVFDLHTIHS